MYVARLWKVWFTLLAIPLVSGCSATSSPASIPSPIATASPDRSMTGTSVSRAFAEAWTEGDFGAAGGLLCAGVAAPQLLDAGSGTPVTFRPTGGASRGPDPSAAVDTSHPHIDYHVPVHGQQGGTTVRGSVEVTLDRSDTSPCIRAYTMVIDAS